MWEGVGSRGHLFADEQDVRWVHAASESTGEMRVARGLRYHILLQN